jgi:hypothetical protein
MNRQEANNALFLDSWTTCGHFGEVFRFIKSSIFCCHALKLKEIQHKQKQAPSLQRWSLFGMLLTRLSVCRECSMPLALCQYTKETYVIFPMVTGRDEWNYLTTLRSSDLVGYPNTADQGYYARVLRYKYPQSHTVALTVTTFQVLQAGISAVPVKLTSQQIARQKLFDVPDIPLEGTISKKDWLQILAGKDLFPQC